MNSKKMTEIRNPLVDKRQRDAQFEREFMPFINPLFNFAFRLSLDEDDANDLVQDTYLKAYRFFDSYQPGTNAKAWLFRILKNTFINEFRRKSKQPTKVDYQEVESSYNSDDVEDNHTTDVRAETTQVIVLCDLEGFTYEEMAKILDIPIGTVRSRLHRARNLLKDRLIEYARKMGYNTTDD